MWARQPAGARRSCKKTWCFVRAGASLRSAPATPILSLDTALALRGVSDGISLWFPIGTSAWLRFVIGVGPQKCTVDPAETSAMGWLDVSDRGVHHVSRRLGGNSLTPHIIRP